MGRAELRTTSFEGRELQYLDTGPAAAARTLVLVHAFPLGAGMWEPQLNAFPAWRVIVPALAGFDGSALLPDPHIDGYARDVLAVLDAAGAARAVFAGLSMGGYVIYGVLRHAASRVDALVLADTRSAADTEAGRAGREQMLQKLEREGVIPVADDLLPKLLGPTTVAAHPEVVTRVRTLIEAQSRDGIAAATRAMMARPDSTALLEDLRRPALVLVGQEDTLTPLAESEQIHRALSGSRLEVLPGAGHLSNMENPDAFNAVVGEFLKETGVRS